MKKLRLIIIVILVALIAVCGYFYMDYSSDVKGSGSSEEVTIEIEKGMGANSVANLLQEKGIIKNALYFKLYTKQNPVSQLHYGSFTLRGDMSYSEIINTLSTVSEKKESVRITIPEGTTLIKIAQIVQEAGFGTAQEFIDIVENTDWSEFRFYQYVEDSEYKPFKMEGFLYPETYEFFPDATLYDIAHTMLAQFDSVINDEVYAQIENSGFTLQEVITLASYVQEEAGDPVNQHDVAAVFLNRLKEGSPYPKLESDVSYYYMREFIEPYLGVGRDESPIEMQNAVNTYLCDGIPVTPVSSPGFDAIDAVLNPTQNSPYYFFLTDLTGKYYYAETFSEHSQNINTMKEVNAGIEG